MLKIDGTSLSLNNVVRIARQRSEFFAQEQIELSTQSIERLRLARRHIEDRWLGADHELVYGFNTGVGRLKDWRIPTERIREYQAQILNSHSAGLGDPFPEDVVRATMLLRINANALGYSGVRVEVLDRMISMLRAGIHPIVPQKGSVGASGDLAPLAYIATAITGHPKSLVSYQGSIVPAKLAFHSANLQPEFDLEAKEALALVNGSTVSLAVAILAAHDALVCISTAEIALALSLEAMRGELSAFDPRLHDARPHQGQVTTARNVRILLTGSERCTAEARSVRLPDEYSVGNTSARIQDAYSLRCAPQVHGPVRDALGYIMGILETETNSATDNPLMFPSRTNPNAFDVISGGNFHGQYVAQAMDLMAMALTDLGSISERRASRMLDPITSFGLPQSLVAREPGFNTGFAVAQCSMAALVSENKSLCWPASADSIPTKGLQEDHVSNSTWCARKAAMTIENTYGILAIELLMATQAIAITQQSLGKFRLGTGTARIFDALRQKLPAVLENDRWLHEEINEVIQMVRDGAIAKLAIQACPELEGKEP